MTDAAAQLAEARLTAALAGRVSDVAEAVALVGDPARFVTDTGDVDQDAVDQTAESIVRMAEANAPPPTPSSIRKGVGESPTPPALGARWLRDAVATAAHGRPVSP